MNMVQEEPRFQRIGAWSELKLEIVEKYAAAYCKILKARRQHRFHTSYIDGFSGAGFHISRETGQLIKGSPVRALRLHPGFNQYHFVDLDSHKVSALKRYVGSRQDVRVYESDCNEVLLSIIPQIRYEEYRRALCLLDPYGPMA
jgi:three-Cys-motif partner protein